MDAQQAEKEKKSVLNQEVLSAARNDDVAKMKKALANGGWLETRRPIHMRPQSVNGVKKKWPNNDGLTPLMYACQNASMEMTKLLLEAKADVRACDEDGMNPLHFAAEAGAREVCIQLLTA